jgi:hypothetical protein
MKCNDKTYLGDIVVHTAAVLGDNVHMVELLADNVHTSELLGDNVHTAVVLENVQGFVSGVEGRVMAKRFEE